MKDYRFPENIALKRLSGDAATHASTATKSRQIAKDSLQFDLNTITITPERISATLTIAHTGTQPLELIVLPCGGHPFPYGGSSPFLLKMDYSDKVTSDTIRYTGVLYPPAPPPPATLEIPPRSRTHFAAELDLTSYTYQGTPEIRLAWSFCLYGSPLIQGTVTARLQQQ